MRVTGRGETDAARNLEVSSWSLGIGSKEEMQEEGIDLKNCLYVHGGEGKLTRLRSGFSTAN